MKIIASIECRMTSSRLPGKVLMDAFDGMSMLEVMIRRVQKSKLIDGIVLATTVNVADDPIVDLAKKLNIDYYRGSEEDVLGRVVKAHESVSSDIVVELTGDCPVIDPILIDECIEKYLKEDYDYVSNCYKRTYPDGSDVQVFSLDILKEADSITQNPLDREHVSSYLYMSGKYTIYSIEANEEYYYPELAVTLDTKEDYTLLYNLFQYFNNIDFSTLEYIQYFKKNTDLLKINSHIKRKGLN